MTDEEIREFADMLSHAAENFRLPAVPGVWPDWMTPEKRRSMSANFDQYALELYVMLSRAGANPDAGLPTAEDVRGILAEYKSPLADMTADEGRAIRDADEPQALCGTPSMRQGHQP